MKETKGMPKELKIAKENQRNPKGSKEIAAIWKEYEARASVEIVFELKIA